MSSLISVINKNYGTYTITEKKIAKVILNHQHKIKKLSIRELSEFCKVSASTITRFCRKIGYNSFIDFRLAIPDTPKQKVKSSSIMDTVSAYYMKSLKQSMELIDLKMIERINKDIKEKKIVYIWGLGSSGRTSSEFEQTLTRMGILVRSVTDSHMLLLSATQIREDDLVIIISISGRSREVLKAVSLLNSEATVAAITSDVNSPLAKKSDYYIQISDIRINNHYFVNFQLSLIFLINCIAESLLLDDDMRKQFDRTVELLSNNYK